MNAFEYWATALPANSADATAAASVMRIGRKADSWW
jgi:hypothetical protein